MLPKFWIADKFLIITFFFDMRTAPEAKVTVVIIGSNSGVRPTASATANNKESSNGLCMYMLIENTKITNRNTIFMIKVLNRIMPCSNSVCGGFFFKLSAMCPYKLLLPVLIASAVALPPITDEPEKTTLSASRGFLGLVFSGIASFSTGIDSPVSADW